MTSRPPETPSNALGISVLAGWGRYLTARVISTGAWGILFAAGGAAIGIAIALLLPLEYTTSATFIAQNAGASSLPVALQGLAASVGLDRSTDYSPKFYADLLTSRPVLDAAIHRRYRRPGDPQAPTADYIAIEGFDDLPPARASEEAMRHLAEQITTRADVRTNIITVLVTARGPELAREIADYLLAALDSLNITFRQEQSRELREFYQSRVTAARVELDSAEGELLRFLQRNRSAGAPLLAFEEGRLQREVDLKRAVYSGVVQQYEQARLQEARSVPTLTLLSPPFVPARKSGPPRRLIVLLCTIAGFSALLIFQTLGAQLRRSDAERRDALPGPTTRPKAVRSLDD